MRRLVIVLLLAACGGNEEREWRERSAQRDDRDDDDDDDDRAARRRDRDRDRDVEARLLAKRTEDNARAARTGADRADARRREADHLREQVLQVSKEREETLSRIGDAVDTVVAASSDAERAEATAKLDQLRVKAARLAQRLAELQAEATRARRLDGAAITKECIDNPLAKGCI